MSNFNPPPAAGRDLSQRDSCGESRGNSVIPGVLYDI